MHIVMSSHDTPSRTSRHNPYNPRRRKPWEPHPDEPEHALAGPVRDLCAEIEHYKRAWLRADQRALSAEAEVARLRGLLRPEVG